MPPVTSRDFQRAAAHRHIAAEALFGLTLGLDARYLGGYTVECSLKALILELTLSAAFAERLEKITTGAKMHSPDTLIGILREQGVILPLELGKRIRRFEWSTSLRYESGRRDLGETRGFLKTAKAVCDWVEVQLQ